MAVLEDKRVDQGIQQFVRAMQPRSSALLLVLGAEVLPIIRQGVAEGIVGDKRLGRVLQVAGRAAAAGARTT